MLQLDNFLVAFSLEVGGKFIGFFALITNSIVLPLATLLLIAVSLDKDFQYIREQLELMEIQIFNIPEASNEKALKHLREYVMVSLVLLIIISTIYIIAAYLLIRGTTNVRQCFSSLKFVTIKFLLLAKSSPDQTSEKHFTFLSDFFYFWIVHEIYNKRNVQRGALHLPFCCNQFPLEKVQR
jgi:hypothetical protein